MSTFKKKAQASPPGLRASLHVWSRRGRARSGAVGVLFISFWSGHAYKALVGCPGVCTACSWFSTGGHKLGQVVLDAGTACAWLHRGEPAQLRGLLLVLHRGAQAWSGCSGRRHSLRLASQRRASSTSLVASKKKKRRREEENKRRSKTDKRKIRRENKLKRRHNKETKKKKKKENKK